MASPTTGRNTLFPTHGIDAVMTLGTKVQITFVICISRVHIYAYPWRANHGLLWVCAAVFWGSWARFASMRAYWELMATVESGNLSATALEGGCFPGWGGVRIEETLMGGLDFCWVWMGGVSRGLREQVAFDILGAVGVENAVVEGFEAPRLRGEWV